MTDYAITFKAHSSLPTREDAPTITRVFELFAVASLFILPYLMLFAAKAL